MLHGAGRFTNDLPTLSRTKSPSFVGQYAIHGAYGYGKWMEHGIEKWRKWMEHGRRMDQSQ